MMNKERLEYLVNEMYYNYLEKDEAQELTNYIKNLEQRIDKAIDKIKELYEIGEEWYWDTYEIKDYVEEIDEILGGKR